MGRGLIRPDHGAPQVRTVRESVSIDFPASRR